MSFQAFPYRFIKGPLVHPDTGLHTADGLQFNLSLFNRTGGSDCIAPTVTPGLIAQCNSQTSALLLGHDWNQIDAVPIGTGVQIPPMKPGLDITVFNNGQNPLNVYPFGGAAINNGAINAPSVLAPGQMLKLQCWTTTQLRTA